MIQTIVMQTESAAYQIIINEPKQPINRTSWSKWENRMAQKGTVVFAA